MVEFIAQAVYIHIHVPIWRTASAYTQQTLPTWVPIMTSKAAVWTCFIVGGTCAVLGALLFAASEDVYIACSHFKSIYCIRLIRAQIVQSCHICTRLVLPARVPCFLYPIRTQGCVYSSTVKLLNGRFLPQVFQQTVEYSKICTAPPSTCMITMTIDKDLNSDVCRGWERCRSFEQIHILESVGRGLAHMHMPTLRAEP